MQPTEPVKVYTLEAVWTRFSLKRQAFYRLVSEGKFPRPRKIAGKWGYTEDELAAYILLAGRWEPGPFGPAPRPRKDAKKPAGGTT